MTLRTFGDPSFERHVIITGTLQNPVLSHWFSSAAVARSCRRRARRILRRQSVAQTLSESAPQSCSTHAKASTRRGGRISPEIATIIWRSKAIQSAICCSPDSSFSAPRIIHRIGNNPPSQPKRKRHISKGTRRRIDSARPNALPKTVPTSSISKHDYPLVFGKALRNISKGTRRRIDSARPNALPKTIPTSSISKNDYPFVFGKALVP